MFTPYKIISDIKPKMLSYLENDFWNYNYDITEKTVSNIDTETNEQIEETVYEYVQVRIFGIPTFNKCCEAILKTYKNEEGVTLYDIWNTETNEQIDSIIYKIKVDFHLENELSELDRAKKGLQKKIEKYDTSDNVNSFILNGIKVWLNKDTRVGLMNSLNIEKNSGKETSTLWFNNICININCDAAIQMLSALELYALACYNVTAEHKVAVENLTSLEEVKSYDYTTGYPEKLSFTV